MSNVVPFRPKKTERDVVEIAERIFFSLAYHHEHDAKALFSAWLKRHPEILDSDVRLAFGLAFKALLGFERLLLDHAVDDDDGGAA